MNRRYITPQIRAVAFSAGELLIDTSVPQGSDMPKSGDGSTDVSGAEAKQGLEWSDDNASW